MPPARKILEICCESVTSALAAEAGGADRIELCDNLAQGGTTPSGAQIRLAKRLLRIPVFVLIRPRKADFLYSELEFDIMLEDIRMARELGADGVVSGALLPDGHIDTERLHRMVEVAHPLPFTYHRAFDMCRNPLAAIDSMVEAGVARILTSGQMPTAVAGMENISRFVAKASGRIAIMACGDLLPGNIDQVANIPGLSEFHSAARKVVLSKMKYRGATNMGDEEVDEEFRWSEVDPALVRAMHNILNH
jgi:copper homeostasis protein